MITAYSLSLSLIPFHWLPIRLLRSQHTLSLSLIDSAHRKLNGKRLLLLHGGVAYLPTLQQTSIFNGAPQSSFVFHRPAHISIKQTNFGAAGIIFPHPCNQSMQPVRCCSFLQIISISPSSTLPPRTPLH